MSVLATLVVLLSASVGQTGGPGSPYGSVAEGWRSSPVYVDPSARSAVPDTEAVRLARRVDAQNPPVRIAFLPASGLPGWSPDALLSAVVGKAGADGVYLVVYTGPVSGTVTGLADGDVSAAVGRSIGVDAPVEQIVTEESAAHPPAVAMVDSVLTRLGVPSSPADDSRRWTSLLLVALLAALSLLTARGWYRARQNLHQHPAPPANRDSSALPGSRDSSADPESTP